MKDNKNYVQHRKLNIQYFKNLEIAKMKNKENTVDKIITVQIIMNDLKK
jgi:hypothetical protein